MFVINIVITYANIAKKMEIKNICNNKLSCFFCLLHFIDNLMRCYFLPNIEKWTYLFGFVLKSFSSKDAFMNVESRLL